MCARVYMCVSEFVCVYELFPSSYRQAHNHLYFVHGVIEHNYQIQKYNIIEHNIKGITEYK